MEDLKMDIGKRIKFYRNNAGLTQEELANKACMSRSYLADVERNRYNPSLDTLDKIISALNITKSEFYKDEECTSTAKETSEEYDDLPDEDKLLLEKIKSLSKEDAQKILDIIAIFESKN
jgi:transcriptional regulator with XRE-family HTH domain